METSSEKESHPNVYQPILGVLIMIIASIFIGYYLTMTVILRDNKTNNRNKEYQSLLMGFWMGLIELLMVGFLMKIWYPIYSIILLILIISIILFTWMIYEQVGINDNQFMLTMIEHHQMAVDMVRRVRPKTKNKKLIELMNNIETSQEEEIEQMKEMLDENCVPNNFTSLFY